MKKITFLLALLCAFATANAYDFQVGDLCYKIFATSTNVSVVMGENYATTLNGALNIPGQVTNNGTTYTVISIDSQAFQSCTGLTSVTLPESVTSIYWNAFSHCENLSSINLPSGLKVIDTGAFQYCTSLTSITIPASVVSINGKGQINYANRGPFYGCDNLETIVVEAGNQYYDSRDNCNAIIETATNTIIFGCKGSTFPASVIIGKGSFKECTMTSLDIPEGVTIIEENAFNSCHNLETVTLQSVTTIGQFAFSCCDKLKTVTLPASLNRLDNCAFLDCTSLADLYANPAGGTVTLGSSVWAGVAQAECNLHVSPADYEYYSTADQWKEFNVIDGTQHDLVGDVTGDGNVDVSDVNAIVNIILGKKTASDYPGNADITGEGTVDVSDVNAIVNIILGKTNQ